jgi:hypothetical protein
MYANKDEESGLLVERPANDYNSKKAVLHDDTVHYHRMHISGAQTSSRSGHFSVTDKQTSE